MNLCGKSRSGDTVCYREFLAWFGWKSSLLERFPRERRIIFTVVLLSTGAQQQYSLHLIMIDHHPRRLPDTPVFASRVSALHLLLAISCIGWRTSLSRDATGVPVRGRVRIFPAGATLQLELALARFARVAASPRGSDLPGRAVRHATTLAHEAGEEAVDKGLEGGERSAHDADVAFDGRPDGAAVVVI